MSKYKYEGYGVVRDTEIDFPYHTDDIVELLDEKDQQISDLEAKLAESEKKAYSRGHSQRDIANEIKLNALREDVANKEKRIVELNQQLAITKKALELACETIKQMCGRPLWIGGNIPSPEPKDSEYFKDIAKEMLEKDKEISEVLAKQSITCLNTIEKAYQDKISFALEQLEKVKELLNTDFESTISWIDPYEDGEYLNSMTYNHNNTIKIIDNQIKQLKEISNEK